MMVLCPKRYFSLVSGHSEPGHSEPGHSEPGHSEPMIGILIYPDFQILDAAGPISVFEIAARLSGAPSAIKVLSAIPGAVRSASGAEMLARKFGPPGAITTLIIAGGDGVDTAARNKCTIRFVR